MLKEPKFDEEYDDSEDYDSFEDEYDPRVPIDGYVEDWDYDPVPLQKQVKEAMDRYPELILLFGIEQYRRFDNETLRFKYIAFHHHREAFDGIVNVRYGTHYKMEATFVLSDYFQATINSLVATGYKVGLMEETGGFEEISKIMDYNMNLGPGEEPTIVARYLTYLYDGESIGDSELASSKAQKLSEATEPKLATPESVETNSANSQ